MINNGVYWKRKSRRILAEIFAVLHSLYVEICSLSYTQRPNLELRGLTIHVERVDGASIQMTRMRFLPEVRSSMPPGALWQELLCINLPLAKRLINETTHEIKWGSSFLLYAAKRLNVYFQLLADQSSPVNECHVRFVQVSFQYIFSFNVVRLHQ